LKVRQKKYPEALPLLAKAAALQPDTTRYRAESNSMTHPSISAGFGLTSSTNAGREDFRRGGAPLSRCFSLV
jgi:hypothetical protein